jgi:hypothetical protein
MSHLKFTTTMGAAILVAALAACSSGTTAPAANNSNTEAGLQDSQVENDVANATSPDAAGDAADFSLEGNSGTNFGVAAAATMRPGQLSAMTACGPSTTVEIMYYFGAQLQDTVTFNRTREWFADGACSPTWTPSVDSVEYVGTWDEHLSDVTGNWTQDADRVRNSSVYGSALGAVAPLDSATSHIWNANAVVNDTIHFQGSVNTRNYAGIAYDTASSVTFAHPRDGEVYPNSGTWTRWATWNLSVTGAVTKTATIQRHIIVTFNGTQFVPLEVINEQTGQVALTCQVNLLTHRIVAGSCQAAS